MSYFGKELVARRLQQLSQSRVAACLAELIEQRETSCWREHNAKSLDWCCQPLRKTKQPVSPSYGTKANLPTQ